MGTRLYDSTGAGEVQATWAGLISSVMVCVTNELEDDKRSIDKNATSLLRRCIAAAEGRKRTNGIPTPLLRRAGKVFAHVLYVLQSGNANFTSDYVHILRNNLLIVPEYCSRAKQSVFEQLIEFFASKTAASADEVMSGDKKEEAYRCAAAFYLLLRNCPFDLSNNAVNGLLETFKDVFSTLREDGRTPAMVASAMNHFLLKTSLDVSSRMGSLHESVSPYLVWAFKGNVRDKRLKEELIKYCYVQMSLGVISDGGLEDLLEILEKHIDEIGSDRGIAGNNADRFDVKLGQKLLFELYCDAIMCAQKRCVEDLSYSEGLRSSKRARGEEKHVQHIMSKLLSDGGYWGAAFCVLLKRHGSTLSKAEMTDCANRLVQALGELFSQGSMSDMKFLAHALWMIRCLQEIAGNMRGDSLAVWTDATNCLIYWLPAHLSEIRLTNEILLLFATLVNRGLIHPSLMRQKFWLLSIFDFAEVPTLAALELVSAVASVGLCEHVLAGRGYEDYFKWLLRGLLQRNDDRFSFYGRRANVTASSDVALLRVQSAVQNSFIAGSHRCWVDDGRRMWLELPDEDHVEFLRHVESLHLVAKPFTKLGLKPRDAMTPDGEVFMRSDTNEVNMDPEIHGIGAKVLDEAMRSSRVPADTIRVCTVALGAIVSLVSAGRARSAQAFDWGMSAPLVATISGTVPDSLRAGLHLDSMLSSKTTILDTVPALAFALQQVREAAVLPDSLEQMSEAVVLKLHDVGKELLKMIENGLTIGTVSAKSSAPHSQEAAFFDDLDFDMVDADTQRSNTSQVATTSSTAAESEGTVACYERHMKQIVRSLDSMSNVLPDAVLTHSSSLLRYAVPPEGVPPRGPCGIGVSQDIAEIVIAALRLSRADTLMGDIIPVLQAVARGQVNLDENAGLMSTAREWLLKQLAVMTYGLCDLKSNGKGSIIPGDMQEVLGDLVHRAAGIVDGEIPAALRNCEARALLADCILSLFTFDLDYFQPRFGEVLAWLLSDDSYLVRIHAGYALSSALNFFLEADHTSIFQNTIVPGLAIRCQFLPSGTLDISTNDVEHTESEWSSLHIISAVGIVSPVLEPWCAFMIIYHRARRGERVHVPALNALRHLAEAVGHPSLESFVEFHSRTIGKLWIDSGTPASRLFEVPEVLGLSKNTDVKSVAFRFRRSLLPALVLEQDRDGLSMLAMACECGGVQQMIQTDWDAIQARLYASAAKSNPDRKAIDALAFADSLVKKSGKTWNRNDSCIRLQTLLELLMLSRDPVESAKLFDVPPPYSRSNDIIAVIERFMSEKDSTITWNFHVIFRCMLHVHEALDSAKSSGHKLKVLAALKVLLLCIGDEKIRIPALFRYVFFMLIPNLDDLTIGTQCARILAKLTTNAYKELHRVNDEKNELALAIENLMVPLMFVLSSVVESASSSSMQRQEALKLLIAVVTNPPKSVHQALRMLPPLPDSAALKDVTAILSTAFDKPDYNERLASLVETAPTLPKTLRRVTLRAGGLEALQHKSELLRCCNEDESSSIPENVWRFAELVVSLTDTELYAIAAELLSLLGPLRPNSLAFITPERKLPKKVSPRNVYRPGFNQWDILMAQLLKYLSSLLCSPSSAIVRSAASVIQGLFTVKRVSQTHQKMWDTDKFYISPFASAESPEVPAIMSMSVASVVSDTFALDDERLWTVGENDCEATYEKWVCALAHRLLSECKSDPIFLLLASLIISDYHVAELVLPHMFFELADAHSELSVTENAKTRADVSRGITSCLNRASTKQGIRAAKLILGCLDYCRGRRTAAFKLRVDTTSDEKIGGVQRKSRLHEPYKWSKVFWFDVDYLIVAQAALRAHAPLTAILFVEHWLEEKGDSISLNAINSHGHISDSMDAQGHMSDSVPPHLAILLEAQSKLSEPDGLYGLLRSNSLELQLRLSEHEGHWDRALAGYDLLRGENIASENRVSCVPMLKALRELGCSHLLRAYSKALSEDELASPDLREVQYEAAWRAGQWTLPVAITRTQNGSVPEFNQSLHSSLRALERGDIGCATFEVNRTRAHLLEKAISDQAESAEAMNTTIIRLRMLDDVSDAARLWRHFTRADMEISASALRSLSECWHSRHLNDAPFKLIEPSLALQGVLLRLAGLNQNFAQHMTRTSILARKAGHLTEGVQAIRALRIMASRTSKLPSQIASSDLILASSAPWRLEEAKLLWAEGKSESAIAVVNSIMQTMGDNKSFIVGPFPKCAADILEPPDPKFIEMLCLSSKWRSTARTESAKVLWNQFLACIHGVTSAYKRVVAVHGASAAKRIMLYTKDGIRGVTYLRLLSRCHYRLGQFADAQFRQISERLSSPEWARSENLRELNEHELTRLMSEKESKRMSLAGKKKGTAAFQAIVDEYQSISARVGPMEKQVMNDRNDTVNTYAEYTNNLITALQSYRRSLEAGGWNSESSVFRMMALWFEHCGSGASNRPSRKMEMMKTINGVNAEILKLVSRETMPSYIFLELSHQIVSRLGSSVHAGNNFVSVLELLVSRLMREHPYHVLYQIQALTRGDRVSRAGVCAASEKIAAAKRLLEKFGSEKPERRALLAQMDRLIEAYIKISSTKLSDHEVMFHPLPNEVKKRALSNLNMIPVLTAPLALDPTCEYPEGWFPYFLHFGDSARLVGGVNVPKVVDCHGSDGKIYKQLAKSGNDDLRQDAVIQQFFGLVNTLLKRNMSTNSRCMRIRTYKVIPFSPEAGLLEFVEDATLLAAYLVRDRSGAHERYRPLDMKHRDIAALMRDAQPSELDATYEMVCKHFKPVMHNFFLEHFSDPSNWFERRVAYTRSCAVNSIVGYVIGLGDRHSSNILIDKWTAEFVHIDFGVTFEQGLTLKTPERVPFRLTRDIVDGMGACGVEGIMRRCCEETMKVLRSNREALTTIIAVLVHDPILKWAVGARRENNAHASKRYNPSDLNLNEGAIPTEEGNLDAERALMRVKQKLDGYESGELRSVQGQVQQLLHDARDPHKLATMYAGWAPWI